MKGSAKVQLRRSRVQKCKGGRGRRPRGGHAGTLACCEAETEFQVAGGGPGWRVAGIFSGLGWREGRADHPWSAAVEQGCSTLPARRSKCRRQGRDGVATEGMRVKGGRVADGSLPCFAAVHHASSSPVRRGCVAQNRKLELTSKTAAMIAKAMKPTNEKAASRTEVEIVCETVSSQRSSSAR